MENEKNKNREFDPEFEANPEFEVDPDFIEWICQRVMNENDRDQDVEKRLRLHIASLPIIYYH